MSWLLRDFDLLSVLLRGLALALEALTLGGLIFLLWVARPAGASAGLLRSISRSTSVAALAFALVQVLAVGVSAAMLVGASGLPLVSVASAGFFLAGMASAGCALLVAWLLRSGKTGAAVASVPFAAGIVAASVAMSHAAARMSDRALLAALTALHHLGMAGWIGSMLFLLLALRRVMDAPDLSIRLARRYSVLAMVSVALLVSGGIGLSWLYIGSGARLLTGLYGTTYGVMVMAKVYLALAMLLLGASNQRLLRGAAVPASGLLRLRRFSEVEIALGFTAVLAAASLSSLPPAADLAPQDRVTGGEIIERLRWQTPRLTSPPVAALAPPISLEAALPRQQFDPGTTSDANDRAWSEYNHHWAGLIVLAAALLALVGRTVRQPTVRAAARTWPLLFLGLAVFILLRADPENWPLGPRPFWASFSRPDVLEHRLYALLITCFAFFEWAVERRLLRTSRAAYFFPLVCAAGGAALLTHTHGLVDMHEELLAELSHTPIALLGATAGWGRWLELRLPGSRVSRLAACVWPACLALVGLVLLDYREA